MRKPLCSLIGLIVLLHSVLLWSSPSEAASIAGSSCTKAGSTTISSNRKFTCIKSEKALIWNKGVTITKSIPTSKATPQPSSTPSPILGSFLLPVPMGTSLKDGGLTYTLNSVKFNVDSTVCTATSFNSGCTVDSNLNNIVDPASPFSWISVTFTVQNSSTDIKNLNGFLTQFNLVLPSGTLLKSDDYVSGYHPLLSDIQVIPGGTGTGDVLFQVPKAITSLKTLLVLRDSGDLSNQHDYYFQIVW